MFAVIWLFMIRPQQKKAKQQGEFLDELSKGQEVVTSGGMVGKISKIDGSIVTLALDPNGKTLARVTKGSISKEMTDALAAANGKSEE